MLLTTESIVSDGGFDVSDEYRTRAWRDFYDGTLTPTSDALNGRLLDTQGAAFPALLAPAYAIGGRIGVELFLAAIAALGFTAAAALGRRLVPDPWATGAALAVGLSPPAVLAATTISPAMTCATLIAFAAVLALRVRDDSHGGPAVACALLLAPVIWLYPLAAAPAAVVAAALFRWLRRRRRAWTGIAAIEIVLISLIVFVSLNGRLYGGWTPYSARSGPGPPTGIEGVGDVVDRLPRLATLWVDPALGLLVYAPVPRPRASRRSGCCGSHGATGSRAPSPAAVDVEVAAGFLAAICAAALLAAVVLVPSLAGRVPGRAAGGRPAVCGGAVRVGAAALAADRHRARRRGRRPDVLDARRRAGRRRRRGVPAARRGAVGAAGLSRQADRQASAIRATWRRSVPQQPPS